MFEPLAHGLPAAVELELLVHPLHQTLQNPAGLRSVLPLLRRRSRIVESLLNHPPYRLLDGGG